MWLLGSTSKEQSVRKFLKNLERARGFEPPTPTLARLCSTPELHPHRPRRVGPQRTYLSPRDRLCKACVPPVRAAS